MECIRLSRLFWFWGFPLRNQLLFELLEYVLSLAAFNTLFCCMYAYHDDFLIRSCSILYDSCVCMSMPFLSPGTFF